jgi:hypothetical protein
MNVFDDLTDNEWALVGALFDAQPATSERRGRPAQKHARLPTACCGFWRQEKVGPSCRTVIRRRRPAAAALKSGKPTGRLPK